MSRLFFLFLCGNYEPFPDVYDRYVFSIFVTEGRLSSLSFKPEYIVSSSILWIGMIVMIWCFTVFESETLISPYGMKWMVESEGGVFF